MSKETEIERGNNEATATETTEKRGIALVFKSTLGGYLIVYKSPPFKHHNVQAGVCRDIGHFSFLSSTGPTI